MSARKALGLIGFICGLALCCYGALDALDGRLTILTRHDVYVFDFAERPAAFLKMLFVLLGGGIVLGVLGWHESRDGD